jgi:hypothetical protein
MMGDRMEPDYFDYDGSCPNCGGEGVIYCCMDEIGCIDPEGGCEFCERRCDWCQPKRPTPNEGGVK